MHTSLLIINALVILALLGGYQAYMQLRISGRRRYKEGIVKFLQYLTGIPALISLVLLFFFPHWFAFAYHPLSRPLRILGIIMFDSAIGMVIWSHLSLGKFWSAELETRVDHKIITIGPYRWVRHPLYTSYLFLSVGFVLMVGHWFVGVLLTLYFMTVAARAWKEEEMLCAQIGEPYAQYMEQTKRFLPLF